VTDVRELLERERRVFRELASGDRAPACVIIEPVMRARMERC
jgi:hypothetical protein